MVGAGLCGLTLETARNVVLVAAVGLVVAAVVAVRLITHLVVKLLAVAVLVLLAAAVWSQRRALDDCADQVVTTLRASVSAGAVDDTTCTFLGRDVTVSAPRRD
jgi:hypothetical protein